MKNQYIGGNCLKRWLEQFVDLRGRDLAKKRGVMLFREG